MKKLIFIFLIGSFLLPVVCNARDMTITGIFSSGTRYFPATFGYEDDQYALDNVSIGKDWQKYLDFFVSNCENNACDVRGNVVPDKSGIYSGIIKSIKSIRINRSAG